MELKEHHLRQPTRANFEESLLINVTCGFFSLFELDCMHNKWKNYYEA